MVFLYICETWGCEEKSVGIEILEHKIQKLYTQYILL